MQSQLLSLIFAWLLLTFLIMISLSFRSIFADNPTSIIQPYQGPDPGYIIAESNGGLANRLRVLASYMYIGERKFHGAHLVFIWDKNEACPGHFLSIFEQIKNVIFATNSSRYVLDKHAKIVYENSYAVMTWILMQNHIPKNKHGYPTWSEIEYKMYSRYFPTKEIMMKVNDYVKENNICNSSAMHLRSTDLDQVMGERKKLNINAYHKFVESRPINEKIFMLTDNYELQKSFIQKYGKNKILVYNQIEELSKQKPLFIKNSALNENKILNITSLPPEHRHTTLEHTLIDIIIAAHAKVFKPSPFSSLSELVKLFDYIGKKDRGWCSYE